MFNPRMVLCTLEALQKRSAFFPTSGGENTQKSDITCHPAASAKFVQPHVLTYRVCLRVQTSVPLLNGSKVVKLRIQNKESTAKLRINISIV